MINLKLLIFTNKYVFRVIRRVLAYMSVAVVAMSCGSGNGTEQKDNAQQSKAVEWKLTTPDGSPERTVAIDTMDLRNPFVRFDRKSNCYYMVGDGGHLWSSKDMRVWNGPYDVLDIDTAVWYSKALSVVAPEIHKHNDRYYYLASFERDGEVVAGIDGSNITGRSCVALVADDITGPYRVIDKESELLEPAEVATQPTFFTDELNAGYMIYTHAGEQTGDGSFKIIRFTDDNGRRMGEAFEMFKASEIGWAQKTDNTQALHTVEAPYLFVTDGGEGGMLFTARKGDESTIGVAYTTNEFGHWLNGPWVAEPEPLVKGNVGGASLFTDYDGTLVMVFHKDTMLNGKKMSIPQFMKAESQFKKLETKGYYNF